MTTLDALHHLKWPDEFVVEYVDGSTERLLRGKGVGIEPPGDDPEGIGGINADLPKKHPSNQKKFIRYIRFTELHAIRSLDGKILWSRG